MAQNLFKTGLKRDFNNLADLTEHAFEQYARHYIKSDLETVDNEYKIKFPFEVIKKVNDITGSLDFSIQIPQDSVFIRESDGEEVYKASLFTWLDKGVSVSYARFITNEETGEKEVIPSRRNFKYDNPYKAKNWTVEKAAYHQSRLPVVVRAVIRKFFGGR